MANQTSASPPKRALGRGLSALIPESDFDMLSGVARGIIDPSPLESPRSAKENVLSNSNKSDDKKVKVHDENIHLASEPQVAQVEDGTVQYIELEQIEPNPFQPRQVWSEEELENLADSIREHGILQPVLVRPLPDCQPSDVVQFQLIAGERRWRAAIRANLNQIPAIVRDVDNRSALELAIIENVQRHDISAVESAQAYRRLSDEFGLSQEKIAARVGKSRAAVANTIRLLDLPDEAIEAIRNNDISEGHGRALLTASDDGARRALLRRTLRDHLTVREVERLAREATAAAEPTVRLPRANAADIARLEDTLQRTLGMRLRLRARKSGGQLIIEYSSTEELQRLATNLTNSAK